jgi:threonine dehydrogenase-like Zn-dependent dehydrogenase
MRRLEFVGPLRLEFREVTERRIESADQVIVRPVASTTCDLDRAIIAGVTPFEGPFAIGHECVADVVEVGDDAGVVPGARVVVPWLPCCTVCAACLQGRTGDRLLDRRDVDQRDRGADLLGGDLRLLAAGVGEQEHELVAASRDGAAARRCRSRPPERSARRAGG